MMPFLLFLYHHLQPYWVKVCFCFVLCKKYVILITIELIGLTWLLVYRTEKYKKLKNEVEKRCKKCKNFVIIFLMISSISKKIFSIVEKKKETMGETSDRQQKKKLEREEEKLKNHNRDLSMVKMKSMFAIGITFTALLSMFNSM